MNDNQTPSDQQVPHISLPVPLIQEFEMTLKQAISTMHHAQVPGFITVGILELVMYEYKHHIFDRTAGAETGVSDDKGSSEPDCDDPECPEHGTGKAH